MEEEKKTIDDFTIEIPENDISGDKEREENSVHDGTDALGPSCCKDESNDVIEELQESKVSESEDVSVQENTISRIEEQLQMLNDCFEQKIKTDAHKAELFDKMYDELQSYKTDLYAKILKPFILSTIALIDDTNSFLAKLDENDSRKAEKYLRGIPDDLIDILESNGVELFESESEIFDPRTQKVIKTVPVNDAMLEKHIVRHVRPGYKWNDSILKPEIVIIYKFEANH